MKAPKLMLREEAVSDPILPPPPSPDKFTPQRHKRRASDIVDRTERRAPLAEPWPSTPPETDPGRTQDSPSAVSLPSRKSPGCLLLVQDAPGRRTDLGIAPRLAGLQVIQAKDQGEAIRILMEGKYCIDALLVIHHPSTSSSAAALIRRSLVMRPGLHVMTMVDSGPPEERRTGHGAGAASTPLRDISVERSTPVLKQNLYADREARSQELRRRGQTEPQDAVSPAQRGLLRLRSWLEVLKGGRRKTGWAIGITCAAALLTGMGLASALDGLYRSSDRHEALMNRILERMDPSRGSNDNESAGVLRWQALQQIGLTREANEATRRYYQDHLQELRWQNHSGRILPPEPVVAPPPNRNANYWR